MIDRHIQSIRCLAVFGLLVCLAAPGRCGGRYERMAALQETVVSMHEQSGTAGLFTYHHDPRFWLSNIALGKLRVGVETAGGTKWLDGAADLRVRNIPSGEGVEARGTVGGVGVLVEALPTARGRETMRWEGLALFKVSCSAPSRLVLEFGGLGQMRARIFADSTNRIGREEFLTRPDFSTRAVGGELPAGSCVVSGDSAVFETEEVTLRTAVRFARPAGSAVESEGRIARCRIDGPTRGAWVLAGFSESGERARELVSADPIATERECRERFAKLGRSAWVKTPSKRLDDAFQAAEVNLEYAWVRPYGWMEAVHHWITLYSQQQNLAADWIGQADRSREMLLTHAGKQYPNGQIPQLDVYGRPRLDFGGWNQFYAWDVEHYWRQTGDLEFLRRIREPFGKMVEGTFAAHDADGNGLLGFGQQIGNQEDYISTPEDGASPTIAGIEMRRIQAEISRGLGETEEARRYGLMATAQAGTLRRELWNGDLGRYSFYRDALGVSHLDGQYHTLIWPVICGMLDPLDGYTSMRHLGDTLTGEKGQIFTSNNFPSHVVATVGSQAGGQQQPWATLGWAKLGDGEKAVGPLEWIAGWVMDKNNQGSWCEVAEDSPAYFTPPAGVYMQGVIEGVFGLKLDRPAGKLEIAPCLPDSWPKATLHLPEFDLVVAQSVGRRRIECRSKSALRHLYRVAIPASEAVSVRVDGRAIEFGREAGVGREFVRFGLSARRRSVVELAWKPVKTKLSYPSKVSPGEWCEVEAPGVKVRSVGDPGGVLAESRILAGRIRLRIREGVAADAVKYGDSGVKTLSRRTVFACVETGQGHTCWLPIDFAVVPAVRVTEGPILLQRAKGWRLRMRVEASGDRPGWAWIESGEFRRRVSLSGTTPVLVDLTRREVAAFAPGINAVKVTLEDGRSASAEVDASPIYSAWADLRSYAGSRARAIPLPAEALRPDDDFHNWRWWSNYGHPPWFTLEAPLKEAGDGASLTSAAYPGLGFANPGRKVAVVSRSLGKPSVTIPVGGSARRIWLLMLPLLDNHDVFSPVGRAIVRCANRVSFERVLYLPGDLGWWGPRRYIGGFSTAGTGWSRTPEWETGTSVLNVISLDLGGAREVESVTVETIGAYPALGVVGVTALGALSPEAVEKLPETITPLVQTPALFDFQVPSLEGWKVTGEAWGIGDSLTDPNGRKAASRYFASSLAGGEQATGTILSPKFAITGGRLSFLTNGHGKRNYYALVDAVTGRELRRAPAPDKTGVFEKMVWDVSDLRGRSARFKAVDAEDGDGYAWIAFDAITIE